MFWLSFPLICFILLNSIDMSDTGSTREKPPRIIPKTIVPDSPRIKPVSPKVPPTIVPDNNEVGTRIKPKVIDDDSDGDMRNKLHTFESISLTPTDSDSDDYEPPPTKAKHKKYHKHKSRTITVEPDDMSEMINKTDDDSIKGHLANISTGLLNSVKDSVEDLYIDRKRTAKQATVGGIGSFVIIVVMICMIVLIKKI